MHAYVKNLSGYAPMFGWLLKIKKAEDNDLKFLFFIPSTLIDY